MTPIYQNQNCDLRSSARKSSRRACSRRGVLAGRAGRGRVGFTLVELLLAIGIIAILASLAVALVRSAEGDARASRTTTVIGNITQVIQRRVEAYETRTLPFRLNPATSLEDRRQLRNQVIVEWLRGELPTVMRFLRTHGTVITAALIF